MRGDYNSPSKSTFRVQHQKSSVSYRLQVEALGGFTLLHRAICSCRAYRFDLPSTFPTAPYAYRDSFNDLLLTAGLGRRYRLSPRFALSVDLATTYNLTRPTTFNDGFPTSTALGLRYRLGR